MIWHLYYFRMYRSRSTKNGSDHAEANTDDESCNLCRNVFTTSNRETDGSCINDFDLDEECDEIDY